MYVGVCVNHSWDRDIEKQFSDIVENGFHHCQLVSWIPQKWTDEEAAKIKTAAEKLGVVVTAFWCGWEGPCVWNFYEGQQTLGLVPPEYREMRIKNLCDGADFALKFGVKDVVTHMGFIPENPNDPIYAGFIESVRAVAEHLKANGQNLLFETGQETPVAMLRAFEDVGTDNLGVNFDTGNVILYGKANPVDAIDVIGKHIKNIHAKDGLYPTNGHDLGEEVKIGTGKANLPEFLRKMHSIGYDGPVIIEREISGEQQNIDILEAKALLESVIAEF
ncbi:MAG: sugar phosphate isomerase/epimerase [Clostridia bacterium]|nr:sugar phosphate isomerase/epimerase [Clostridia bacterium]